MLLKIVLSLRNASGHWRFSHRHRHVTFIDVAAHFRRGVRYKFIWKLRNKEFLLTRERHHELERDVRAIVSFEPAQMNVYTLINRQVCLLRFRLVKSLVLVLFVDNVLRSPWSNRYLRDGQIVKYLLPNVSGQKFEWHFFLLETRQVLPRQWVIFKLFALPRLDASNKLESAEVVSTTDS